MSKRSSQHKAIQRKGKIRDNYTCQICGSKVQPQAHHIIPVQFHGAATLDNIVTLCDRHHDLVHKDRIEVYKF